jgi:hypothetical protein
VQREIAVLTEQKRLAEETLQHAEARSLNPKP